MVRQEDDYSRRRRRRQRRREMFNTRRNRRINRLYIPTIFFIVSGNVMTFLSIVKGLGEGTLFWSYRDVFHIAGPVTLVVGLILLFVTVGFVTTENNRVNKENAILDKDGKFAHFAKDGIHGAIYCWRAPILKNKDRSKGVPVMAFEEEEFFSSNVKTKPYNHDRERLTSNNNYVLAVSTPVPLRRTSPVWSRKSTALDIEMEILSPPKHEEAALDKCNNSARMEYTSMSLTDILSVDGEEDDIGSTGDETSLLSYDALPETII